MQALGSRRGAQTGLGEGSSRPPTCNTKAILHALRPTRLMGRPRASAPVSVCLARPCRMLPVFGHFRPFRGNIRLSHIESRRPSGGKPRQAAVSRGLRTHWGRLRPGTPAGYTARAYPGALWTPRKPLFPAKAPERLSGRALQPLARVRPLEAHNCRDGVRSSQNGPGDSRLPPAPYVHASFGVC